MSWLLILGLGLVAGTIGGVIGFGASIILLPVLVWSFGPIEAVPVMAIAGLIANLSRVAVWWREIDWKLNAVYCATAIPAAAIGARTMLSLDPRLVEGALGVFFLAMIPTRRWLAARGFKIGLNKQCNVIQDSWHKRGHNDFRIRYRQKFGHQKG